VVHSLPGFKQAVIARYGYAVEYDFVNPQQLEPTLRVKDVEGLYLAGQINGTSGYEEAATQGLIAGINALQQVRAAAPVIIRRDQGYSGVMIDDLVTLGTEEPYRMFTSRAEHRLLLGCDSVYERLTTIGVGLGIVDEERRRRVERRMDRMDRARTLAQTTTLTPDHRTLAVLAPFGVSLHEKASVARLLQRHDLSVETLMDALSIEHSELTEAFHSLRGEELEGVVSQLRYAGYVDRQRREADRSAEDDLLSIPRAMGFTLPGLSTEVVEKLRSIRPASLGQAARIPGVTPAAVSILRMHLRRGAIPAAATPA